MSNSVFNQLGGNVQNNQLMQIIQQFNQFKQTLNGNPKDMVMQMLNSGKVSQRDIDKAQAFAQQFQHFLK